MFNNILFNNNNYSPFSNFSNYYNYPYRRQEQEPAFTKSNDTTSIIIHRILNDANNYICFDCHKQINCLKYFDIKNAIFLCYNCAIQHSRYPREVTEVMSGDIRDLEEHILYLLYFGGNKNLADFMKRYYPLLEKMEKKNMYSTIAMDYYRKLIKSKINNEREPYMPRKLEGYNSIFRNGFNPANENVNVNKFEDRNNKRNNGLYNSMFNFNRNKNIEHDDDVEMKDVNVDNCSKKRDDSIYEDAKETSDKINKNKNMKNETKNEKEKIKIINDINFLNINQLGELSMYPDAFEIDRMDF